MRGAVPIHAWSFAVLCGWSAWVALRDRIATHGKLAPGEGVASDPDGRDVSSGAPLVRSALIADHVAGVETEARRRAAYLHGAHRRAGAGAAPKAASIAINVWTRVDPRDLPN